MSLVIQLDYSVVLVNLSVMLVLSKASIMQSCFHEHQEPRGPLRVPPGDEAAGETATTCMLSGANCDNLRNWC